MCRSECWPNIYERCMVLMVLSFAAVICMFSFAPACAIVISRAYSSAKPGDDGLYFGKVKGENGLHVGKMKHTTTYSPESLTTTHAPERSSCLTQVTMEEMRHHADAFIDKMQAWVVGGKYTRDELARLAHRQNMILWRAFMNWRRIMAPLHLGVTPCNFWPTFSQNHRFRMRPKYLASRKSPRFRKTCQNKSRQASIESARAQGGKVCSHKHGLQSSSHTIVSNELNARGTFDPFASPAVDGGLGWEKRGKSCAVVGSSPGLVGGKQGNNIDAHDAVIRFNTAVVEGHEADLGSRTDIRLTSKNRIFYEDCHEIVLNIPRRRYSMASEISMVLPMEPIFYLAPSSSCSSKTDVVNNLRNSYSISQLGACLALDLCEHIDIYGLEGEDDPEGIIRKLWSAMNLCM